MRDWNKKTSVDKKRISQRKEGQESTGSESPDSVQELIQQSQYCWESRGSIVTRWPTWPGWEVHIFIYEIEKVECNKKEGNCESNT